MFCVCVCGGGGLGLVTGPRSVVGNESGNRCESECRSRGR